MVNDMSYISTQDYKERCYAGILGKLIGVYMGRPVEGWPYDRIKTVFGMIQTYPSASLGLPLIVADDDISASLTFIRAGEEHDELTAENIGKTWLNQIIENKTVLWWGGMGRSTEHTALINLQHGIPAPLSGSIELNGEVVPIQIGAQIFNDIFTMLFPRDPETARRVTIEASSVSHDGVALDISGYLAAIRADAFGGDNIRELIERHRGLAEFHITQDVIDRSLELFETVEDWREARDILDENFGYETQVGGCPAVSNLAMTLLSLLWGGDDFHQVIAIASSAGLDTDSNAGLVGLLTGIRLGIDAIPLELREPVSDRAYVVSAEGGECVTDAVREAKRVIAIAHKLHGIETTDEVASPRFTFEFSGSVQGFQQCRYQHGDKVAITNVRNGNEGFLHVRPDDGRCDFSVSTPVALDQELMVSNFNTIASPTLYPSQTVTADVRGRGLARLYVAYQSSSGVVIRESEVTELKSDWSEISWSIPRVGNLAPVGLGLRVVAEESGELDVNWIDWGGAPSDYVFSGRFQGDIWDLTPIEMRAWVSNAEIFEADFESTFVVSQARGGAVATVGTRDWSSYQVSASVKSSKGAKAGILVGCGGLRRYLKADIDDLGHLQVVQVRDDNQLVLTESTHEIDSEDFLDMTLSLENDTVQLVVEQRGRRLCETDVVAPDVEPGAAGIYVENGTAWVDSFRIQSKASIQD